MVTSNRASDRLPSLPQVLLRILDAIHADHADFQQLADIVRQDTAMTARLLGVANSGFYSRGHACQNVERALLVLGTDSVKTIVITAAIKQYFNHFSQRHREFLKLFWRHSLIAANLAQVLAHLTRFSRPDEAYLCGLLMDVGQLRLLTRDEQGYSELLADNADDDTLVKAEQAQWGQSHCDLGADLIESWQLSPFIADAVRYHQEPAEQVRDAHHLVKIINLANILSQAGPVSDRAINAADTLFGLTESLTRELRQRIGDDVERLAGSLGIDISTEEAEQNLGQRLSDFSQLSQVNSELLRAEGREWLQQAVQRTVYMTLGVEHCLLFISDPPGSKLTASIEQEGSPEFELPLSPGRSLVTDAVLEQRSTHSGPEQPAAVVDRQLLRLCRGEVLFCLPLLDAGRPSGVLVLGVRQEQLAALEQRQHFVSALGCEIGAALNRHRQRLAELPTDDDSEAVSHLRVSEAVHEAGNPLSIIRNYLEMLRIKLGEEHEVHSDLELIKQEIDRVGHILLRLKEPAEEDSDEPFDANELLQQIGRIFERSILSTHDISLRLLLDEQPARVRIRASHLKQIVTNLVKNAAEALGEGGTITIETEAEVSLNGQRYCQVTIADDGPGLPESVKQQLYQPLGSSSKGEQNSGLGLSIVKRLVDESGGTIVCRTGKSGTQFQLLLPSGNP